MMAPLAFVVHGTPAPQGSKAYKGHRNGKPILVEMSKRVKPWRQAVCDATTIAIVQHPTQWQFPTCPPMLVTVRFLLTPPQRMPAGREGPTTPPDLDKLVRSTLDGLTTAGAFIDDAYVVELHASKAYAQPGKPSGAYITVRPVDDEEATG